MKVFIGGYPKYHSTQQFADLLKYVGVSRKKCLIVGDWLENTWVGDLHTWVSAKSTQTIQVRIDKADTWSMDNTLAHIVLPMLKQLKETKHGAPNTRDVDVPKHLRSTAKGAQVEGLPEMEIDNNHFLRWDYIMGEMIWAFEELITGAEYEKCFTNYSEDIAKQLGTMAVDHKLLKKVEARKSNGFMLFGRYYQALWD